MLDFKMAHLSDAKEADNIPRKLPFHSMFSSALAPTHPYSHHHYSEDQNATSGRHHTANDQGQ